METTPSTAKARIEQLTDKAAVLALEVMDARDRHAAALRSYAAGECPLAEVQAVAAEYAAALDAEKTHRAALVLVLAEQGTLEVADRRRALEAELDAAREKLAIIEGTAARRLEAAERELRAAHAAAQEARTLAREVRNRAQQSGFQLLALLGEGVDTAQRVPTAREREDMLDRLARWNVQNEQALPLPSPLALLPHSAADSFDDHARRWKGVLEWLR